MVDYMVIADLLMPIFPTDLLAVQSKGHLIKTNFQFSNFLQISKKKMGRKITNMSIKSMILVIHEREKGRDLTQSCDKNPYTHRTIQKAT